MRQLSEQARREYRDGIVRRLVVFAACVATERQRIPYPGEAARRFGGVTIIPAMVHDALCGWRVTTEMDAYPRFRVCGGCGLGYELVSHPWDVTREDSDA